MTQYQYTNIQAEGFVFLIQRANLRNFFSDMKKSFSVT